jgi:ankyrin repeat domain-containing protein 50
VLCRAAGAQESTILDIFTSTEAVLFLGTPHRGSSKAETAEMIRRIASASGFSTSDRNLRALYIDSTELEGIHERFMMLRKQNQWHFEIRTFQEAKGLTGIGFLGLSDKVSQLF